MIPQFSSVRKSRKLRNFEHKSGLDSACFRGERTLLAGPIYAAVFALFSLTDAAFSANGDVCDQAARKAAMETGVPVSVLRSITRTETGRQHMGALQPWPWTVNMEGKGHWFGTDADALAFVLRRVEGGARSFDVGCFQINYKWHGASFRSIEHMFDPLENARYAASFLARLFRETGDWSRAAGAYHSRTPEFARSYRARFDRILTKQGTMLATSEALPGPETNSTEPRQNTYPLLIHAGATTSNGSLVPLRQRNTKALVELTQRTEGS